MYVFRGDLRGGVVGDSADDFAVTGDFKVAVCLAGAVKVAKRLAGAVKVAKCLAGGVEVVENFPDDLATLGDAANDSALDLPVKFLGDLREDLTSSSVEFTSIGDISSRSIGTGKVPISAISGAPFDRGDFRRLSGDTATAFGLAKSGNWHDQDGIPFIIHHAYTD